MPTEGVICDNKRVLSDWTDVAVVFRSLPLCCRRHKIFIKVSIYFINTLMKVYVHANKSRSVSLDGIRL